MHPDCERARLWASSELDLELSEFERALLGEHLAVCAGCSAFRAGIGGSTRELRSAPMEELENRIVLTLRRGRRRSFRLAPAVAALAVGAVGLGSLLTSANLRSVGLRLGRADTQLVTREDNAANLIRLELRQERVARDLPGRGGPVVPGVGTRAGR